MQRHQFHRFLCNLPWPPFIMCCAAARSPKKAISAYDVPHPRRWRWRPWLHKPVVGLTTLIRVPLAVRPLFERGHLSTLTDPPPTHQVVQKTTFIRTAAQYRGHLIVYSETHHLLRLGSWLVPAFANPLFLFLLIFHCVLCPFGTWGLSEYKGRGGAGAHSLVLIRGANVSNEQYVRHSIILMTNYES